MKLFLILIFSMILYANNQESIKDALIDKFLNHYTNMQIDSIEIKPSSKLPKEFDSFSLKEIQISKSNLQRNKGSFLATFTNGVKTKKVYYTYDILAFLDVYVAKYSIKRNEIITPKVLIRKMVKFENFRNQPIDDKYFYNYSAKRLIKAGQIVTTNYLKKSLTINSGDFVIATIKDGLVEISFRAKAIQGGNIGDIITIKRGYKKRFKAQIISKNRVEVIE